MPVPSSGQLRLRADIALEVDGSATNNNVSLNTLSNSAGFTSPNGMKEFYGYSSASVPSVTTSALSNSTLTSMTANGNVTNDNGGTITERGFYFGTNSASPINNTKYTVGGTTGTYTRSMTGLSSSSTYYCWAFATNSAGTTFGSQVNLATLTPYSPTVVSTTTSYTPLVFSTGDPSGTFYQQYLNPQTNSYVTYSTVSWAQNQAGTANAIPNSSAKAFLGTTTRYYLSFVPYWFTNIKMRNEVGNPGGVTKASASGGTNNPMGAGSNTSYGGATVTQIEVNTDNTSNSYYMYFDVVD